MSDTCPCCGSPVRVHTSSEGTSSYEPVVPADAHVDSEELPKLAPEYAALHRACVGAEHDPVSGRLHGYCVVCGVPWPCDYAPVPGNYPADALDKVREALAFYADEGIYNHYEEVYMGPMTSDAEQDRGERARSALTPKAEPVCGRASGVRCTVPLCPYPDCDAFLRRYKGPRRDCEDGA